MPTLDEIRDLATAEPGAPVLSALLRTDLRDPENVNGSAPWRIELRNGLSEAETAVPAEHADRVAFRRAAAELEAWAAGLDAETRARSVARFLALDGSLDRTYTLRLPLTRTVVVQDASPYVLPLLALADRGRPTGLVLMAHDRVRLASWVDGVIEEPPGALYQLEGGQWRDYAAYAAGNPARAQQTGRHPEGFGPREEHHREGFLREAARAVGGRVDELGWRRLVLVGERRLTDEFERDLPVAIRDLVADRIARHLVELTAAEIAGHVEPTLLELWRVEARGLVGRARELAEAGGAAAAGLDASARALLAGRVERLLVDPFHDFADEIAGSEAAQVVLQGAPAQLMAERAAEAAIARGGEVTSLPGAVGEGSGLDDAGGIAALLRY